tara:strand:+ start:24 stop:344 length:321 start_codon:yes stop_codon:yes gene_type:complete
MKNKVKEDILAKRTKREVKEVVLIALIIILAILVGSGCTYTKVYQPLDYRIPQETTTSTTYEYYVIDESAKEPDAYFVTKKEADSYKEYFKEHHNYKVVSVNKKDN